MRKEMTGTILLAGMVVAISVLGYSILHPSPVPGPENISAEAGNTASAADDAANPLDISGMVGDEGYLVSHKGQMARIENARAVDTEDVGGDLFRFLYGADGNGDYGDDLYFSIEKGGNTYLLKVESDICREQPEVYQVIVGLEEDTTINLAGILTGEDGSDGPLMLVTDVSLTEE